MIDLDSAQVHMLPRWTIYSLELPIEDLPEVRLSINKEGFRLVNVIKDPHAGLVTIFFEDR